MPSSAATPGGCDDGGADHQCTQPSRHCGADRDDGANGQAGHAVQGDQAGPAEHADTDASLLPFPGHCGLGEFQFVPYEHRDLLGQVLNQSPVERPREMGSRMPSVA